MERCKALTYIFFPSPPPSLSLLPHSSSVGSLLPCLFSLFSCLSPPPICLFCLSRLFLCLVALFPCLSDLSSPSCHFLPPLTLPAPAPAPTSDLFFLEFFSSPSVSRAASLHHPCLFPILPLPLEDASGSGDGQHYADDWMAGAAAVAPPARAPRPPRREGAGGKGGVIIRHSQDRSRTGGTSAGFHTQPLLILFLLALALLGPR